MRCINRSTRSRGSGNGAGWLAPALAAALCLSIAPGAGAETCQAIDGERIRASDLAKVYPEFTAAPAGAELAFAPAPGARRRLSARQMELAARRWGIPARAWPGVCFEWKTQPLNAARIERALETLAAPGTPARIEVLDFSRFPVPDGPIEFAPPRIQVSAGGPVLVRGVVRYGERRSALVWARVRVETDQTIPVTRYALASGHVLRAADIRWEKARGWPATGIPSGEELAGMSVRRALGAGTRLDAKLLAKPREIHPGQTVEVEVSSGAARLRLAAKAETGGSTGDRILLKNNASGRRLSARVTGPGKATLTVGTVPGERNQVK